MARQFQPDQVLNTTWPITMWFDAEPTYWDVIQRESRQRNMGPALIVQERCTTAGWPLQPSLS
jgi:hypothetical protein